MIFMNFTIHLLELSSFMNEPIVIMGAGVAGLTTAKLLSDQGRKVVIIDQSFDPVVQSEQLHVLLSKGQEQLKKFFPEVYKKITVDCSPVNWGNEIYWRSPAGVFPQRELNLSTYLFSRSYLDRLLIADLREQKNCEFIKANISGIFLTDDKSKVKSIICGKRSIDCSICVDTMGRGSRISKCLEREFSKPVQVDELKTTLKYFSYMGRRKDSCDFKQVYYQIDSQKERYGGVISPVQGNKVIATFITINNDFKPQGNPFDLIEDEAFQKFIQGIELEPKYKAFGQLHNRHHRFDKYKDLPENLFLIGDSVCQFNPVFGQGMTVALNSAELLCKFLKKSSVRPANQFQSLLIKTIQFPWLVSTMDSYNERKKSRLIDRLTRAFMHRVMYKAQSNPQTHETLVRVLHMLEKPFTLIRFRNLF